MTQLELDEMVRRFRALVKRAQIDGWKETRAILAWIRGLQVERGGAK